MYRYWLSHLTEISPGKKLYLLEQFHNAKELFHTSEKQIMQLQGLSQANKDMLIESRRNTDWQRRWNTFLESGLGFVTLEDDAFPIRLREIANAPYSIFYRGKLPDNLQYAVAVVGARQRSAYGQTVARMLGNALAKENVPVISGLALGIDADAHKGCLEKNGKTFAVLGCGVDVIYPRSNRYLYEELVQMGGGILSEYPPGTPAQNYHFPMRNRIISALSNCVVVVEARKKSGSLITADYALEQGKDVYAVPGRVADSLSEGCNQLIHDGCGIYISAEDFLKDIGILNHISLSKRTDLKNILEKEERLLYSLIDFTPTSIGVLMQKTSFSFSDLLRYLEQMIEKEVIAESPANFFVRTKIL